MAASGFHSYILTRSLSRERCMSKQMTMLLRIFF